MILKKLNESRKFEFSADDKESIKLLQNLALDLRWSWNHAADKLWKELDPELWEQTKNPSIVLRTVSHERLQQLLTEDSFCETINELIDTTDESFKKPDWFQKAHPESPLSCVAYFSMEYMVSESLPIYVGGLGNVAGDQLKSASDLGVPVVAVGLLYQQGYFRQEIDQNGNQKALFPYNDPGQLPITPLRLANGEWLRIRMELSGCPIWLRTWEVQVGKVKLYLLDSNDVSNLPIHRGITSELYGGGSDMRIKQEIILGIGGFKLLTALGIKPEVCHMNEGHAAFLVLERASVFMKQNGIPFKTALEICKAGNLFTTHTAVAAGFDHFGPDLMRQFFESYAINELGIPFEELMALGRQNAENNSESFNMAFLAIRGAGAVNAVSRLHESVSRNLFRSLFPRWPEEEIPIGHVTNGVHMPTWDSEEADAVWTQACGKERWRGDLQNLESSICRLSGESLWKLRNDCRSNLVNYIRERLETQLHISGKSPEIIEKAKKVFDPNTLTIGFARRFVAYKRPNLLLHDEARFIRILKNMEHPVQVVIAGKAPPFDESGISLIREWILFIEKNNLYDQVVFLTDYDMLLTEHLVQGIDVWLNTPRRPWEACGTSGMKVLVNGGINLSELDGWWAEAYGPKLGWALGDEKEHGNDPSWDAEEANALYDLIEKQVVPEFYSRSSNGIPIGWVDKMRESMSKLTPRFSANRTVRQYTESYYIPAAANYLKRSANKCEEGLQISRQLADFNNKWDKLALCQTTTEIVDGGYVFHCVLSLNGIKPAEISVELYAQGQENSAPERQVMRWVSSAMEGENQAYQAAFKSSRPAADFTVRIIPNFEGAKTPLENNRILWQH